MGISDVIAVVALTATTYLAGLLIVFSTAVMPSLDAIADAQALAAMRVINRRITHPIFVVMFVASVATSIGAFVLGIALPRERPWLLAAGALYLVGFVFTTLRVHLPLNAMFDTLEPGDPADLDRWRAASRSWTRYNHVRSTAALASALCYAVHLLT